MRVNVYNEEFPTHVTLTLPRLDRHDRAHLGVRFSLGENTESRLMTGAREHQPAITFWLRETLNKTEVSDTERFITLLIRAVKMLEERQREQK